MPLRDALAELSFAGMDRLIRSIPAELLDCDAEHFTPALFSTMQKAVENHARSIPFTIRIEFAREINDACDAFFNFTFAKVCRLDRVFDNTEMDILLLKELQGGSDESLYYQSQSDRAARFGMSTNAMQARIHALEDGKEILGHHVKIRIDGRGRAAYDNTIHPVFLTLNLKEAYMLTVAMRKAFSGTPFEDLSVDVSSDIYAQLSEYAHSILQPHIEEAGLEYKTIQPCSLVNTRSENHDAIYFLKSCQPCVLRLLNGTAYTRNIQIKDDGFILAATDGTIIKLPENTATYTLEPLSES